MNVKPAFYFLTAAYSSYKTTLSLGREWRFLGKLGEREDVCK